VRQARSAGVLRCDASGETETLDYVAIEEPLEIRIGGEPVLITMRTPGHDLELVAGLLLAERLIETNVKPLMRQDHPNIVNVAVSGLAQGVEAVRRGTTMSSSCGLCGKARIEGVHQHFPPVSGEATISQNTLTALFDAFVAEQRIFERTGGVHAAGLFRCSGELVAVREDIGRHNAVDKAVGHAVLRGLTPLNDHVLLVSGRASFEIVQKALGAGIPIVAAVSAPSSLAIDLAASASQTLVGFARAGRFNIYTHPERLWPRCE
jgi:FdhD protein